MLRRSLPLVVAFCVGLTGCQLWGDSSSSDPPDNNPAVEGGFALKNLVLKQTDQQGKLIWQLQAKAADYGESRKQAKVKDLSGTLFQQGKPAYRVKASQAKIRQQQDNLFLQGKVIITDLRSKGVFTAQEFEWHPLKKLLIARKDVKLTHPEVVITAQEMQASSQTNQVMAKGTVVANAAAKRLRLVTERLIWQPNDQQILAGGNPGEKYTGVLVLRLPQQGKNDRSNAAVGLSDRAQGGSLLFNLKTEILTLKEPAQLRLVDPPLEVDSQQLVWDVKQGSLSSMSTVQIHSPSKGVTLVADRGIVNQKTNQVRVEGNVKVSGQRNTALLTTDQLTWTISNQQIEALGNVFYRQQNPQFTLRGKQAFGLIREQKILVTGGNVVTEIFPQE